MLPMKRYSNSNSSSISEEKIIKCLKCSEPLTNFITKDSINSIIEKDINEFSQISCHKCGFSFTFLLCPFNNCKNLIFMKIHPKATQYNGLNGHNIICKYCQNSFYFTICPKCGLVEKILQYIKEGNVIKCLNMNCNAQYIQIHDHIKYSTDIINIEKPNYFLNYPQGITIYHNNEILYQKINCYNCLRPIIFSSIDNHKNHYYEGQKVECPYEDCKKIFNRIICHFCSNEIYINDGYYEMGSLIRCNACRNFIGKILCPSCKNINKYENNFKFGTFKCGFENCKKTYNIINCIFCKKMNFFDSNVSISGKHIKCGYCENIFNEILCPFCRQPNVFPMGDFSFGKLYKCQYLTCLQKFKFVICPKCFLCSLIKDSVEGQKTQCEKCQIRFINFGCPFCGLNISIYNPSFKIGKMIKCPNEECGKIYSFICCSNCQKLVFSKENENFDGKGVKCPYGNCRKYTRNIICPLCNVNMVYPGVKISFNDGDEIYCQRCKQNFKFKRNNEILTNGITYLKIITGKTIDFGVGKVDENFLAIQNLFFDFKRNHFQFMNYIEKLRTKYKSIHNKISQRPLKECIVCHNNIKESVFFPCGHRCVCYNCAVITFTVTKKCPKCNLTASCIIKKIYE